MLGPYCILIEEASNTFVNFKWLCADDIIFRRILGSLGADAYEITAVKQSHKLGLPRVHSCGIDSDLYRPWK